MSAWDHLPNAKHIDRVLASVKANPKEWDQAREQVWAQAWDQAREQAWEQVWEQVWEQAWEQARAEARGQVMGALMALVTYDDCAKYLKLPIDQLNMLYQLTEHPACILLQPAVLVFAKEKELA
jgi:hypothetical protein